MGPYRRFCYSRRVIVNMDDGTSVEGLFWRKAGQVLVLKQATYLEPGAEPVTLDGDFLVERARVLFIQIV